MNFPSVVKRYRFKTWAPLLLLACNGLSILLIGPATGVEKISMEKEVLLPLSDRKPGLLIQTIPASGISLDLSAPAIQEKTLQQISVPQLFSFPKALPENSPEALYALGLQALDGGDIKAAKAYFLELSNQLGRFFPDRPEMHQLLITQLQRLELDVSAQKEAPEEITERYLRLKSRLWHSQNLSGKVSDQSQTTQSQTIKALRELAEQFPQGYSIRFTLGDWYLTQQQWEKAAVIYRDLMRHHPAYRAVLGLAEAMTGEKKDTDAINTYQQALAWLARDADMALLEKERLQKNIHAKIVLLDMQRALLKNASASQSASAWLRMGETEETLGNYDDARQAFLKALSFQPSLIRAKAHLWDQALSSYDWEQMDFWSKSLQGDASPEIVFPNGKWAFLQRQYALALRDFQQSLRTAPASGTFLGGNSVAVDVYDAISKTYQAMNLPADAIQTCREGISRISDLSGKNRLQWLLIQYLEKQGEHNKALDALHEFLKISPEDAEALTLNAEILLNEQQARANGDDLKRDKASFPAYKRKENRSLPVGAIKTLTEIHGLLFHAFLLEPENPRILYGLSRVMEKEQRHAEAKAYFDIAKKLSHRKNPYMAEPSTASSELSLDETLYFKLLLHHFNRWAMRQAACYQQIKEGEGDFGQINLSAIQKKEALESRLSAYLEQARQDYRLEQTLTNVSSRTPEHFKPLQQAWTQLQIDHLQLADYLRNNIPFLFSATQMQSFDPVFETLMKNQMTQQTIFFQMIQEKERNLPQEAVMRLHFEAGLQPEQIKNFMQSQQSLLALLNTFRHENSSAVKK